MHQAGISGTASTDQKRILPLASWAAESASHVPMAGYLNLLLPFVKFLSVLLRSYELGSRGHFFRGIPR